MCEIMKSFQFEIQKLLVTNKIFNVSYLKWLKTMIKLNLRRESEQMN